MCVADGGSRKAVRGCAAGNALPEDDGRSGCRCCRSGRPEAEVVRFSGETLRHAVGLRDAAIDDLSPDVCRCSRVEAGPAAARAVATGAEDIEFGDGPTSRGADGVVAGCRVDVTPRRHGDAVARRGCGAGESPVGHVGDGLVGYRRGVGAVLPAIGPSIKGYLVPVLACGAVLVVGDEPVLHGYGAVAAASVPIDPLLP